MNNTDSTIEKLLRLRLTRFAYAFCLGLRGNPNPSPEQQAILAKIVNQYSNSLEIVGKSYEPHRFAATAAAAS